MAIASTAPIPQAADLFGLCRPASADDETLASPWTGGGAKAVWFSRAAWGLQAVAAGMASRLAGRPPRVWLPGYFCNQATWPLRNGGAEIRFYRTTASLTPDWDDCARLAAGGPPDLFVLVHYFGFPGDTAAARRFCDAHGAALVEDAAHVLRPHDGIGSVGDYVLYSLYKHLPLPDGGLLVIRPTARTQAETADAATAVGGRRAGANFTWIVKRALQMACPTVAARLGHRGPARFDDDPDPGPFPDNPLMSSTARRLLVRPRARLEQIAAARRTNEEALRETLRGAPGIVPLFDPPSAAMAPYRAVFRAKDNSTAQDYYGRFRSRGGVVETWPDLPPEVMEDETRHAAAISLRRTVLALPIHAGLQPKTLIQTYGINTYGALL